MPIEHILIATDLSPTAEVAALRGCELARQLGARVTLLHVYSLNLVPLPEAVYAPTGEQLRALAEGTAAELHQLAARVARGGVQLECVAVEGNPREAIPRLADERHADIIVVGTHGRRGLARVALGSVAESVVRAAPCPVLVVGKPGGEAAR